MFQYLKICKFPLVSEQIMSHNVHPFVLLNRIKRTHNQIEPNIIYKYNININIYNTILYYININTILYYTLYKYCLNIKNFYIFSCFRIIILHNVHPFVLLNRIKRKHNQIEPDVMYNININIYIYKILYCIT